MREVLVDSGEFSGGAQFFSRSAFRSGWFISGICSMGLIVAGYSYILIAHWNQLSGMFVMWSCVSLCWGAVSVLNSWRFHARLHEMFVAGVVKPDPTLNNVMEVAARAVEGGITTTVSVLMFTVPPLWWALRHAGILK